MIFALGFSHPQMGFDGLRWKTVGFVGKQKNQWVLLGHALGSQWEHEIVHVLVDFISISVT